MFLIFVLVLVHQFRSYLFFGLLKRNSLDLHGLFKPFWGGQVILGGELGAAGHFELPVVLGEVLRGAFAKLLPEALTKVFWIAKARGIGHFGDVQIRVLK